MGHPLLSSFSFIWIERIMLAHIENSLQHNYKYEWYTSAPAPVSPSAFPSLLSFPLLQYHSPVFCFPTNPFPPSRDIKPKWKLSVIYLLYLYISLYISLSLPPLSLSLSLSISHSLSLQERQIYMQRQIDKQIDRQIDILTEHLVSPFLATQ